MYYPYFRGKQFELIAIRESAPLLSDADFIPIIEPVREGLSGLQRSLAAVTDADGEAILIVNPRFGDHADSAEEIENLFESGLHGEQNISPGFVLAHDTSVAQAVAAYEKYSHRNMAFIHAGFSDAAGLAGGLGGAVIEPVHVFLEQHKRRYRRHFQGATQVLMQDGFKKRTNKNHPPIEFFSDLHVTFKEDEKVDGFGDFLIVGDDFTEGGGPAYAVAIHLTFIDPTKDDGMFIFHFKSIRFDTPTDPAGKFAEALAELVNEVQREGTHILRTDAVKEFLDLHERGHFPGLGYVKKLSMEHHMETLAEYFRE